MAMVVQHNLTAMNANRQLGVTTSAQSKSSEKLSSGYRINRAGDDAAGLKISEKMRSQVRGLNKASSNAQDGVSLIQTAEGALNEAHSILQRMNELAVQGANDTNEDIDREAINEELSALTSELDRIASTTQFNKQNLLDGTFTGKNLQVGANASQNIEISIANMNASTLGLRSVVIPAEDTREGQEGEIASKIKLSAGGQIFEYEVSDSIALTDAVSTFLDQASAMYTSDNYAPKYSTTGSAYYTTLISGTKVGTVASAISDDVSIVQALLTGALSAGAFMTYTEKTTTIASVVGTAPADTEGDLTVSSYELANNSLRAIQSAINQVSGQRSALGALQNRLEHTIANLDNVAENTQAAESRIRDTDMASQMVDYSKNNILAQAGQSMLAQSNQSTQGVLSLLQ